MTEEKLPITKERKMFFLSDAFQDIHVSSLILNEEALRRLLEQLRNIANLIGGRQSIGRIAHRRARRTKCVPQWKRLL